MQPLLRNIWIIVTVSAKEGYSVDINMLQKLLLQHVWWPLFGNFDHLHPEYEIYDWNRKSQFLDFAYITPFGRFGIECDGFQSHVKDMDREKFNYSLNRDTFLTGLGWKMIHFSFDDVQHRPEVCRMLLQLVIGPYLLRTDGTNSIAPQERELLQLAWKLGRPIRPKDVYSQQGIDYRTAKKLLLSLTNKGFLQPISKGDDPLLRINRWSVGAITLTGYSANFLRWIYWKMVL